MTHRLPALSAGIYAACLIVMLPATANPKVDRRQPVTLENTGSQANAGEYWTAERFKAAKPLPIPSVHPDAMREEVSREAPPVKSQGSNAQPPTSPVKVGPTKLGVHPGQATVGPAYNLQPKRRM
jgi:hypothetical protein